MAMTLEQSQARNAALEQQNQQLMTERLELKRAVKKLKWSNYYKWLVIVTSLGLGGVSLWIAIWSLVDSDRDGLAETGVALSALSLALSGLGLFGDCGCCAKNSQPQSSDTPMNPSIDNIVIEV